MRRLSYAIGVPIAALGAYLVIDAAPWPALRSVAVWFGGGIVIHDALIAPVVIMTGVLIVRLAPPFARAHAQAVLVVTGCLALATLPLVLGNGRDPNVPSQQPLPYGRNLLIVIGLVWLVAAGLALRRRHRNAHASS